jgi:flagellar biogenesis protein FliO
MVRMALLGFAAALSSPRHAAADVLAGAPSPRPAVNVQPVVNPPASAATPGPTQAARPSSTAQGVATAGGGAMPAVHTAAEARLVAAPSPSDRHATQSDHGSSAPPADNTGLSNQAITAHEPPTPTGPRETSTAAEAALSTTQPTASAQAGVVKTPTTSPATQPAMATVGRDGQASPVEAMAIRRTSADPQQAAADAPAAQSSQLAEVFRVVVALVAVIGLIFGLRWAGRRMMALPGNAGNAHLMQVVGRTALSPRQHLMLVRVGRRLLVIGDSGGQLSSLGQIDEPDEVAGILGRMKTSADVASTADANGFGSLYRRLAGKFNADRNGREVEDWSSGDNEQPAERRTLLARFDADDTEAADASAQSDAGLVERSSGVGFSQNEAEAAVEAARHDIQALRAKLQQVTRRLTEGDGDTAAASESGGRPDAGRE